MNTTANVLNYKGFRTRKFKLSIITTFLFMIAGTAMAFAPSSSGWASEIYDMAVTNILNGPIGFVAGVGTMVAGAIAALQQKIFPGIVCLCAGALLMNAEALVTALGAVF